MRLPSATAWHRGSASRADGLPARAAQLNALAGFAAIALLFAFAASPWLMEAVAPDERDAHVEQAASPATAKASAGREILAAGYVAQPFYYRSDLRLERPDGTDVVFKRLGWDGDMLYPPIDGGIRSVEWWGPAGLMIDFLHNKAVARLGKGAHGRTQPNRLIDEVEASGTLSGKPAPARVKLTDVFERLEFTHGHNVLLLTPLARLGAVHPRVTPYFGIGGGFALPHVEVWFPGGARDDRTSEYQLSGAAWQTLAGLELRVGKVSYFIEYKFTHAWIAGALSGDESWMNFNMPGDLWRQFSRWWRGEPPALGRITTRLGAHQIAGGAGYWFARSRPASP